MGTHIVTGCAGFIGKYIVKRLLEKDNEVIGIDNFLLGNRSNIQYLEKLNENFSFYEIDLSEKNNIKDVTRRLKNLEVDTIWHFAANSDIRGYLYGYERDLKNTYLTTLNILEISKNLNLQDFVFASSSAVVGKSIKKIEENTGPLLPASYYGAMKMASEGLISSSESYFLNNYIIFRFPNVVGADTTHGVFFDFVNKLGNKPKILEVMGNGEQTKPFIYIDDLIDGIFHIKNLSKRDKIYNLTPLDSGIKIKKIAEKCIEFLSPETKPTYEKKQTGWQGDVPNYSYNYEKMLKTGWKPKHSSEEAIQIALQNPQ